MTPRERAEVARKEAWDLARKRSLSRGVEHHELILALDECFATAITEHVRELLADDEATIEMMAQAIYDTDPMGVGSWQDDRIACAQAAFAALRRKALGE